MVGWNGGPSQDQVETQRNVANGQSVPRSVSRRAEAGLCLFNEFSGFEEVNTAAASRAGKEILLGIGLETRVGGTCAFAKLVDRTALAFHLEDSSSHPLDGAGRASAAAR